MDYKKHKHDWQQRRKHAKPGWYITGVVCACGAKEYIDLLSGVADEKKELNTKQTR